MEPYEFISIWNINAKLPLVWQAIRESERWPEWWRGVVSVIELEPGDADGLGAVHRSKWRSAMPYTLEFDSEIVRIEEFKLIEAKAFGELDGTGIWRFSETADLKTVVQYDWHVSTRKGWMNVFAPIAKPLFKWNHDVIMRRGEEGLNRLLAEQVR